jgi:hypothetical protein
MKIGITGHGAGLGQELYNILSVDHEVHGFSLENGYDIGSTESLLGILNQVQNFDCVINNAYHPHGQYNFLVELCDRWHGQDKVIVNIGSKVGWLDTEKDIDILYDIFGPPLVDVDKYVQTKTQQQRFIKARDTDLPKIIHIMPGLIDTDFVQELIYEDKMNKKSVAEVVVNMLNLLRQNIHVHEITFTSRYSKSHFTTTL